MEQTALRPKPMPGGQESGGGRPSGPARRPHAAPRRARQRLITLLFALVTCVVLVLSGVGLGTLGATVIGMSRLAELRESARAPESAPGPARSSASPAPPRASGPAPARPTLGVEVVDAPGNTAGSTAGSTAGNTARGTTGDTAGGGALVVGVHVPGPGYHAGLVRGDVVLALGGTRTGSAAHLARAIAAARPGVALRLVVRHANGTRQYLVAVPGVIT